jgi:hypothetical protein
MKYWCIKNKDGHYWAQGWGWVEGDCADFVSFFTNSEKHKHKLSIDESWERF